MNEPLNEVSFRRVAERMLRALDTALNEVDGLEADLESGILTSSLPIAKVRDQ